ncbi:MAG: Gfo/Idh/MocA family oxidoreductase [Acidobacteria bacterium]|nr:Gfo/Idh/MocA family oxidoreductase [Acidobacteriota bacterium]
MEESIQDQNEKKIRTAVIGVGSLGRHHARNYAQFSRVGDVEFIGVCDVDEETAKEIGAANSCGYFTNWRDLIDKTDAVSIVTPTETHCEIACEFLANGVDVLVEKPIARTLEEADRMIAAAEKSGAKIMVGHLERYNPAMVALHPHVTKPLYFEIHRVSPFPNRSLDVDVVLDVMIHDLDAIQWMVGENVKATSIQAVGIPIISNKVDAANARIEFENGAVANITASRVGTEKIRKTRFYQTKSYVVLDYLTKFASITSLDPDAAHPLLGIDINRLAIEDIEPLNAELSSFLSAIRNGEKPPITAQDGRRALDLALQVLEKIEAHRNSLDF